VAGRRVSAWRFATLRFSRLYPLHLATLALAAAGQATYRSANGSYFVYPTGGPRDLALQLTLSSSWWAKSTFSFNGPIWSVSIEVLLYAMFFAACRGGLRRWWQLALLMLVGVLANRGHGIPMNPLLGLGLVAFFAGGLAYYAVETLARLGLAEAGCPASLMVLVAAWSATAAVCGRGVHWAIYNRAFPGGRGNAIGDLIAGGLADFDASRSELVVFPLAIAALALAEARWGAIGKRLAVLGEVSYSSYLLHFPLQLALVLAVPAASPGGAAYDSPWTLAALFAILFPLSVASYRYLERPAQSALRRALLGDLRRRGASLHPRTPTA
jgi:peptidoglycan/LPS O-acetylase OafA/YrhL